MKNIYFHETGLEIRLKRRRGMRRLALSIGSDGSISLTAPRATPLWYIERFLLKQGAWIEKTFAKLGLDHTSFQNRKANDQAHYLLHREAARVFIEKRLQELNTGYDFNYSGVSVRNQRTRWGSCSANGRLSLNYRILFLPPHLADYVLVHELTHLSELNHGPRFWNIVEKRIPDFQSARQELRHLKIEALGNRTMEES